MEEASESCVYTCDLDRHITVTPGCCEECPSNMVPSTCANDCFKTCKQISYESTTVSCQQLDQADCVVGCACAEGTLYDDQLKSCVPITDCHCYFEHPENGLQVIPPGATVRYNSTSCPLYIGNMSRDSIMGCEWLVKN